MSVIKSVGFNFLAGFHRFPSSITSMLYRFTKTYVTLTTLVPPGQKYPFLGAGTYQIGNQYFQSGRT